jgi:uncharacterized cupin superfamily protein
VPALGERPGSVANLADLDGPESAAGSVRRLAAAAGAEQTGLNWVRLNAGEEGAPPHSHSADEEIFVVLEGEGVLELWPSPQQQRAGREREDVAVRAGHVVSRPASTGLAHGFRAGDQALTLLAYGTRNANDVCYYPRSNKISFRGLGLIARLEDLDYVDGEPR